MVKSSRKGAAFERWLCRELTEWAVGERNPPQLWRSKQSGGWKHRDAPDVGDLAPDGPWGHEFCTMFAVEAKHRKGDNLDFWYLWSRKGGGHIFRWWKKIRKEAYQYDLCPWLVVRRNRYPDLVGYPSTFPVAPKADRLRVVGRGVEFATLETWLEHSYEEMVEAYEEWS